MEESVRWELLSLGAVAHCTVGPGMSGWKEPTHHRFSGCISSPEEEEESNVQKRTNRSCFVIAKATSLHQTLNDKFYHPAHSLSGGQDSARTR